MSAMLKIDASEEVMTAYQKLQLNKKDSDKGEKPMYMVMKIAKNGATEEIVIEYLQTKEQLGLSGKSERQYIIEDEKTSEAERRENDKGKEPHVITHEAFCEALTNSKTSRFGVIDFKGKIFFVMYQPESGTVRDKMKYSSIKDAFKGKLTGVSFSVQATEESEIVMEVFNKKMPKI